MTTPKSLRPGESNRMQSSYNPVFVGFSKSRFPTTMPQQRARDLAGLRTEFAWTFKISFGLMYVSPCSRIAAATSGSLSSMHCQAIASQICRSTPAREWTGKRDDQPFKAALLCDNNIRSGWCESIFNMMNPKTVLRALTMDMPSSHWVWR